MPENVSISYRGANYAIGQGPQFYGIWAAGAPTSQPLEWWPHTPEGWAGAWARFSAIEVPGTISAVAPAHVGSTAEVATSGRRAVIPAGLLALGVALGIAGLFPGYFASTSIASQSENLVLHAIYLAVWAASAVLVILGGSRTRVGALLGIGASAVTFGLFAADVASAISGGVSVGAGLVLSLIGWLAATAGAVLAVRFGPAVRLRRPFGQQIVPVVTLTLAALGAAIAFAPSWDSFTLRFATGTQTITQGNAFANPGLVIAGDVATMIAIVAVVVLAGLWRPIKIGAALVLGAMIPMVAQAISALVQVGHGASPAQLGISPSQASQAGLTISAGVTPIFWVFCAFVATVILMSVWMLIAPDSPVPADGRNFRPPANPGGAQPEGGPEAVSTAGAAAPGAPGQGPMAGAS